VPGVLEYFESRQVVAEVEVAPGVVGGDSDCAVGVAGAYLNAQSGTRPDRPADRRAGARLRRGQQSQEVITLSASGQLGTATTGQIEG
jgi:hypothetical protein